MHVAMACVSVATATPPLTFASVPSCEMKPWPAARLCVWASAYGGSVFHSAAEAECLIRRKKTSSTSPDVVLDRQWCDVSGEKIRVLITLMSARITVIVSNKMIWHRFAKTKHTHLFYGRWFVDVFLVAKQLWKDSGRVFLELFLQRPQLWAAEQQRPPAGSML